MHRISQIVITALLFCFGFAKAQITPPYRQAFDSVNCTGWTHGALTGTDDWQRGIPTGPFLNTSASSPNVWATNLSGYFTAGSVMYLQTPSFDLSSLTKVYLLTFAHKYHNFSSGAVGGNIEYSVDGGVTWLLLNGTAAQKIGWYNNTSCSGLSGQAAWSYDAYNFFSNPAHSLISLQGQSNVKFRFKYGGNTSNPPDGWIIDDFTIEENVPDIVATQGAQFNATKNFTTFNVSSTLVYNGLAPPYFSNTTNYYFSYDSIFDAGDVLLGTKTQSINTSISPWTQTFTMVPNLNARRYWVFYRHDVANNLSELYETNNVNHMVLNIDSVFNIPDLNENFEGPKDYWKSSAAFSELFWKKGFSNIHQAEGTHSGMNSWYIKNPKYSPSITYHQYIESPYLDLSSVNNNVICFWYRAKMSYTSNPSVLKIELSGTNTFPSYTSTLNIPMPRFNDWDCNCQPLTLLNGKNNAKIRLAYLDATTYATFDQNMNIDDIFIGQPKPDLTIEHKNILSTPVSLASDTLYYDFFNGGFSPSPVSTTEFYWSADSLLDAADAYLGSVSEASLAALSYRKEKFLYTKPSTVQGTYYLIYKTDATAAITEMWEANNVGYYKLKQDPLLTLPYLNDFETQANGWWHYASIGSDNWQRSSPTGTILTSAFSGSLAFNTTQFPKLSPMSRMHLYTPIFDFTTITNPVIEFDMKLNSGSACHCFEGKTNLSYSSDGGATWKVIDTTSNSYNRWYYSMDYEDWAGTDRVYWPNYTELLFAGTEYAFATYDQYNSRDADRNTRYIVDIKKLAGLPHVQFRFNTGSAQNDTTTWAATPPEGAVIDNFSIKTKHIDLKVPYKKSLMISSKSAKIKFSMNIKNVGNFISAPSVNRYYVSTDSILDASDFLLGQDTITAVRPDLKRYFTRAYNAPAVLLPYKYLLYELDVTNTNIESNEINNVGNWPLALDSISSYPYLQNFNDTIVQGWNEYTYDPWSTTLKQNQWRFRNMVAPSEYLYQSQIKSGEMFTDRINTAVPISNVPYWFAETPSFDFSGHSALEMSFKLAVFGTNSNTGGNLEYSINGGNTWTVLQPTIAAQAYNWYTSSSLSALGGPGWVSVLAMPNILDSAWFNINFLSGQSDVAFRFKFRSQYCGSSGYPQGMRIDNFRIKGNPVSTEIKEEIKGFTSVYVYENRLYVNYGTLNDESNKYQLTITNMMGQNIYKAAAELNKGVNEFELPAHIANGMYLVNLDNGSNHMQQKIIIAK